MKEWTDIASIKKVEAFIAYAEIVTSLKRFSLISSKGLLNETRR